MHKTSNYYQSMLFNSIEFAFFLPIVFLIYWVIGYAHINDNLKLRLQNAFVVLASYVFYGWWDWRFLLLIAFTSFCSWGSGLLIARSSTPKAAKAWTDDNKRTTIDRCFMKCEGLGSNRWMNIAGYIVNIRHLYYDCMTS